MECSDPNLASNSVTADLINRVASFPIVSLIARRSTRCSHPVSSVNSLERTRPPFFTILSAVRPRIGFADSADVASDPPHFIPRVREVMSWGFRFTFMIRSDIRFAIAVPFRIVFLVPPMPCIVSICTSFPVLDMPSATVDGELVSHPSPTTSAAPMFEFLPSPIRMLESSPLAIL